MMRAFKPAPVLFALALGLAMSIASAPEAHAGPDTIHTTGKMWTSANKDYTGWMKDVEVVFLDGTGAIVESISAPDLYVDKGEFLFLFGADWNDWHNGVTNGVTISIESNEVVEEFDLAVDVSLKSYFLLEKGTSKTTGGIWNEDHGGAEPDW